MGAISLILNHSLVEYIPDLQLTSTGEWRKPPDRRAYIRKRRLDGTVLIEGGANDNTEFMESRGEHCQTS